MNCQIRQSKTYTFSDEHGPLLHALIQNYIRNKSLVYSDQLNEATTTPVDHHGERSQLSAWTLNQSFLMASCLRAFPGLLTNSGSIVPSAAHFEGGGIGVIGVFTLYLESAPASPDMQATSPGFVLHAYQPPPPSMPHPIHHGYD